MWVHVLNRVTSVSMVRNHTHCWTLGVHVCVHTVKFVHVCIKNQISSAFLKTWTKVLFAGAGNGPRGCFVGGLARPDEGKWWSLGRAQNIRRGDCGRRACRALVRMELPACWLARCSRGHTGGGRLGGHRHRPELWSDPANV